MTLGLHADDWSGVGNRLHQWSADGGADDMKKANRYLICYFDVLGQRAFMRQVWKPHSKISPEMKRRIGTHLCAFMFVQDMLRRIFVKNAEMSAHVIRMTKHIPYLATNALSDEEIIEAIREVD